MEVVAALETELPFWLSPSHQQLNAALATAMVASLVSRGLLPDHPAARRAAVDSATWPARFEVLRPPVPATDGVAAPALVIDVAHNEPAVAALLRSVDAAWPVAPLAIVFGANRDKDVTSIARLFAAQPRVRQGVAVLSSHPKATPVDEIVSECVNASKASADSTLTTSWCSASSMVEAVQLAAASLRQTAPGKRARESEADAEDPSGVILCCGSVFVASDMRADLAQEYPALFGTTDWVHEHSGEPALLM